MSWEDRKRGSRYYTRSHRVRGRIVREYVGGGIMGVLAARIDEGQREERLAEAQRHRAEREALKEIEDAMEAMDREADLLMRAALLCAGYHRHKQGEWRKRRADRHEG